LEGYATEGARKRGHTYKPIWRQYGQDCLICDGYIIDLVLQRTDHLASTLD
jgi:hypothetical protein